MNEHVHDHACIHGTAAEPPVRNERDEALADAAGTDTSRRDILRGFTALAAVGAVGGAAFPASAAAASVPATRRRSPKAELVLLGTRAGPPPVPGQAGISTALVVNGATYLVDCGRASVTQFQRAGLRYRSLRGIFLTHLHADHVADYYNYFLLAGHIPNPYGDNMPDRTPVIGPGSADGLPPRFGGGEAPTVSPEAPTPGLAQMTDHLHRAYAYSSNIFLRDMALRDIRTLIDVREITAPAHVGASYRSPAPHMAPFEVFRDDNVVVTATLVPHGPMYPSFAYRFDTEYGSVTFSGDTKQSRNLIELAHRSDVLVHEAIGIEGSTAPAAVIDHMLESHVPIHELGPIAESACVPTLVVSHYADIARDPVDRRAWRRDAQQGYRGRVLIGQDLMRIPVDSRRH